MARTNLRWSALISILVASSPSTAADIAECKADLFKDTQFEQRDTSFNLARLDAMTANTQSGDTTKAGITVPIDGVPVTGSYSDVSTFANSIAKQSALVLDQQLSLRILNRKLEETGVRSYQDCLDAASNIYHPLTLKFTHASRDFLQVAAYWRPSGDTLHSAHLRIVDVLGGVISGSSSFDIRPNSFQRIAIKRTPHKSISVTVSADRFTDTLIYDYVPMTTVDFIPLSVKSSLHVFVQTKVRNVPDAPPPQIITAPSGDLISDVNVLYSSGSPHDGCGSTPNTYVNATAIDSFHLRIDARAQESGPGCGAAADAMVTWTVLQPIVHSE